MLAPILLLYQQEAMAFVVLERTIDVFLPGIFVSNNHLALQERLLGLLHLITFLDPELSNHLLKIGVTPNLYAISWFLTMFAHVLPINVVLNVWDMLLSLACLRPMEDRDSKNGSNKIDRDHTFAQGMPVWQHALVVAVHEKHVQLFLI